jgi:hypothetical protein
MSFISQQNSLWKRRKWKIPGDIEGTSNTRSTEGHNKRKSLHGTR